MIVAAAERPPDVDFSAATSLALLLDFAGVHPRHFGAPAADSRAFQVEGFEGEVARGASCNCRSITLIPHCNGTHTESASHLTVQQRPLHEIAPLAPLPALLLTLQPRPLDGTAEDSDPAPQPGDQLLTRSDLLSAWQEQPPCRPRALMLRTGASAGSTTGNPPYLTRQLMAEIVARGIEHLVVDLPSVDRSHDQGRLTTHRLFFGLPAGETDLAAATRAHCTITELASFPSHLVDGPCALQLQLPAFTGDAVPSRPLHLPLVNR
jgi:kynurenine formamidase